MKQSHFTTVLPAFAAPPLPLVSIKEMYEIILLGVDQLLFQLVLPPSLSPTQTRRETFGARAPALSLETATSIYDARKMLFTCR